VGALRAVGRNSVGGLAIDGTVLRRMRDDSLTALREEEKAEFVKWSAFLDKVKSFGLGVSNSALPTPFPDVIFAFEGEAIGAELELLVQNAFQENFGGGPGLFQEKDVGETKVRYTLTPLGVGVYIASLPDLTIVGSTESAIASAISSAKVGNAENLFAELSEKPGPIVYRLNFLQLATLLETVQGSVAMFTGGSTSLPKDQIERLKRNGSVTGRLTAKGDSLFLNQSYSPPTPDN
jgi:hypothetical protein